MPRAETIDGQLVQFILDTLIVHTEGPGQAFGTICVVIMKLNELNNETMKDPITLEELIDSFGPTMRSIRAKTVQ